jgi:hypothetical protein
LEGVALPTKSVEPPAMFTDPAEQPTAPEFVVALDEITVKSLPVQSFAVPAVAV